MRIALKPLVGAAVACLIAGVPAAAKPTRSIELTRVVYRLDDASIWGHIASGVNCAGEREALHWNREKSEVGVQRLAPAFQQVMASVSPNGRKVEDLFEEQTPAADLQIAAAVTELRADLCDRSGRYGVSGSMMMAIEWQLFDPDQHKIIARIETRSSGHVSEIASDGLETLFNAAFRANARELVSDSAFQRALAAPAPSGFAGAKHQDVVLRFAAANNQPIRPVPSAVGSVALVITGEGHGSGFVISEDGYVLTNQHVVGSAHTVRLRWSDGTESVGAVVRTDKVRDVALIRSEAHAGRPLPLRASLPRQGDTVFAIGAPLDPKLQGTLTRGIVSATRQMDGQGFIQSDVSINHGNSGGPLLNDRGEVIGIAESVYEIDGAPLGISLFIPVDEALRALSLQPAAPRPGADNVRAAAKRSPVRR